MPPPSASLSAMASPPISTFVGTPLPTPPNGYLTPPVTPTTNSSSRASLRRSTMMGSPTPPSTPKSRSSSPNPPKPVLEPYDRTAHSLIRTYLYTRMPPEITHLILPALNESQNPLYPQIRFNYRTNPRTKTLSEEYTLENINQRNIKGGGENPDGKIAVFLPRLRNMDRLIRGGHMERKRIWAVCVVIAVDVKAEREDEGSEGTVCEEDCVSERSVEFGRECKREKMDLDVEESELHTLQPPTEELAKTSLYDPPTPKFHPAFPVTPPRRSSITANLAFTPPTPARRAFSMKGSPFHVRVVHGTLSRMPIWDVREGWSGPMTKMRWYRRGQPGGSNIDKWFDDMEYWGETSVVVEGNVHVRRAEIAVYAC